jgi:hypothetical protein
MVRRELFERVGLFDESLPACEDYDLWLRVSCRFPVHLIETPLIVKRGGHADQLSRAWGLDRFRIAAMANLLTGNVLNDVQRQDVQGVLRRKCAVYAGGCRRRGRMAEAGHYEQLTQAFSNE